MYKILDGKALSLEKRENLKVLVAKYEKERNQRVGLAVILVGNNPASQVYVRNKIKACEEVGIKSYAYYLPEDIKESDLCDLVKEVVENPAIHGVLVQLPLPKHINADKVLALIPRKKDVDGFSEENIGRLCMNEDCLVACTPNGIMSLLASEGISTMGKKAVVVGRSNIVGKPMAMLLINGDATVTVCHSKTKNLKEECLQADILIAAIGKAKFITADMVKEGAIVVDVGMNRDENGKLCGDVDFENVKDKCSYITPVPGGVGPMTITMLMFNAYWAAIRS